MKEKEHKKTPKMCTSVATASAPSKLMQSRKKSLTEQHRPPLKLHRLDLCYVPKACSTSYKSPSCLLSILLSTSLSILRCGGPYRRPTSCTYYGTGDGDVLAGATFLVTCILSLFMLALRPVLAKFILLSSEAVVESSAGDWMSPPADWMPV